MAISHITILGGDLRQAYAAEYLSSCGCQITCFQTPDFPYNSTIHVTDSLSQALQDSSALLMPSPFSQDSIHLFQRNRALPLLSVEKLLEQLPCSSVVFYHGMSASAEKKLKEKNCTLYPLGDSPDFLTENARLTAEGLVSEVIRYTPFSLQHSVTLLLGYGTCGSAIGTLLAPFGSRVYVLEQDEQKQAQAEQNGLLSLSFGEKNTILRHCNLIINTIPQQILTEDELKLLPGNCHIFDIASAPFGFSSDITAEYFLPYFRLPGLPGRFSPKTAGTVIGKTIERMIHHDI